ncbi:hypothetical protein S83_008693 [Arachis hypogaea]
MRQGKKKEKEKEKEKERRFSKITMYVEPRQEEEEPWSSVRGEYDRADSRRGEHRADTREREHLAIARGEKHRGVAVRGGQHRDLELLSYMEESDDCGGCVAVWDWFQVLGHTLLDWKIIGGNMIKTVVCLGNGELQKAIIAESALTTFDHVKVENAIAECVEECEKLHVHDRNKMAYCIHICIDLECTKYYSKDEKEMHVGLLELNSPWNGRSY